MSILNHVPKGYTLRPWQEKALLDVEKAWDSNRVIVIPGDVGFGKSLVAYVIAHWADSTAIITPRVMLQEQYEKSFTNVPVVKGRERFKCTTMVDNSTCKDTKELCDSYCDGCPYVAVRKAATQAPVAVYNFQSYLYNKRMPGITKRNVIIDEAHVCIDSIADSFALNVWQSKTGYPDGLRTIGDIAAWLETYANKIRGQAAATRDKGKRGKLRRKADNYDKIRQGMLDTPTSFFIEHRVDSYRGHASKALHVRPITIKHVPHGLWTHDTNKIVLMSGTIDKRDIDKLGLGKEKVAYIQCDNPIPAARRPFVVLPGVNMGYQHQQASLPQLAKQIASVAANHPNEKGVVHLPYAVAMTLAPYLAGDDRYLWHTKTNKETVYKRFLETDKPVVLMASGMSEGIDLVEDSARWQVITKVMYPSLADALNKKEMAEDNDWYKWRTVRTIRQQVGRVVRSPTDYGVTYMLDSGFKRLFDSTPDMWPQAFREAMQWKDKL